MTNDLYIVINNLKIPYIVKSYKKSKHIKIFFKDGLVKITKPKYVNTKTAFDFLISNKEAVYKGYLKSLENKKEKTKQWIDNEKIFYRGESYTICREVKECKNVKIYIDNKKQMIKVTVPNTLEECEIKKRVDKLIKKHLKNATEEILMETLPYWNNIMKLEHNTVIVKDTIGRYGSCIPTKKALQFSSRIAMLPQCAVDAIVVHELSHIVYRNHDRDFYNLVEKYIPNYKEIDKWLKSNSNQIFI